jgi:hypothetical protein
MKGNVPINKFFIWISLVEQSNSLPLLANQTQPLSLTLTVTKDHKIFTTVYPLLN